MEKKILEMLMKESASMRDFFIAFKPDSDAAREEIRETLRSLVRKGAIKYSGVLNEYYIKVNEDDV